MSSPRGSALLLAVLGCALLGGCGRVGSKPHIQAMPTDGGAGDVSNPASASGGAMSGDAGASNSGGDDASGGSTAEGLCPAAGFVADEPLLGWSDGATLNLLFGSGEVRQVTPIATPDPAPTTGISVLWLNAGRDGWSFATLRAAEATDETSQVAVLRPDGSVLWQDTLQRPYPTVFAGPHGAVVDVGDDLILIDSSGKAVTREVGTAVHAVGGVGAAGEVPASREERLDNGSLLDHLAFVQATARTDLPAVVRGRWALVGEAIHYVESINGTLVWQRETLTENQIVLQIPNTADAFLGQHGAWVVLSDGSVPIAVAREDGTDARLLSPPAPSQPTFDGSANGDWLVGSAELGEPLWRLNLRTGTFDDLTQTSFGTRRMFDASFCTPPPVTDAQGRLLLGLRDDSLGGLFREVSGRAGTWESMGRPVRDVIYVGVTAWADTVLASAETGENTFCPDMFGDWPAPPADSEVLEGASVQLFHPDAEPRVVTTDIVVHPSGNCALLWTPNGTAEILDVPTGTTYALPPSPLRPVWLQ